MINISQAKKIRRDICSTIGHEWSSWSRTTPTQTTQGEVCSRCKKRTATVVLNRVQVDSFPISSSPVIKWNEMSIRKFDILDRMRKRADIDILGIQPPEEP